MKMPFFSDSDPIRVAAIEIRAVDQAQYTQLVDAYTKYQGESKRVDIPGGVSFESGDKEVRIVLPANLDKQNLAVVYWQVKGRDSIDLKDVYDKWVRKYHYRAVEAPQRDGTLSDSERQPTYSGLLRTADNGYQVGLVINPPYPRIDDKSHPSPWQPDFLGGPISWLLAALFALGGLGLGLRRGKRLGLEQGIQLGINRGLARQSAPQPGA